MTLRFQPLCDRIVCLPLPERSTGGIDLSVADGKQTGQPRYARVLAAGDGTRFTNGILSPLRVSVGDTVMLEARAGSQILIDGEKYLLCRENEVIGIIDSSEPIVLKTVQVGAG